jgi:hypothetical protein
MVEDTYAYILDARSKLPAICDEVNQFSKQQAKPVTHYGPPLIHTNNRLMSAILEGFLQRHVSIFDAILLLAKSDHRSEWLMLSRSLFEVSVDTAMFWNEIQSEGDATTTLGRIRYAWSIHNLNLLKESEQIDEETLEKLKEKVVKVPGITDKEH